jgi:hypothetical protein
MGEGNASGGMERVILYTFAGIVWAVNATTISVKGGGFFGEITPDMGFSAQRVFLIVLQVATQVRESPIRSGNIFSEFSPELLFAVFRFPPSLFFFAIILTCRVGSL